MQTISTTTHRGKPCFRWYVNRRKHYRAIKNTDRIEEEKVALLAELLVGPKEKRVHHKPETLDQSIAVYERELLAELGKHRHNYCGQVAYRIRRVHADAKIQRIEATTEGKIKTTIADMRKPHRKPKEKRKPTDPQPGPLSEQSRMHYLQAIKQFYRWLVKTGRLAKNPVAEIKKRKVRVRPNKRDRLQPDELAKLVQHTRVSTRIIESLDGPDRALLYLLAACTGLRKQELGSLTPTNFSLDSQPQLHLESAYTKNGEVAILPLHAAVLPLLRAKLDGRGPGEVLWQLGGGAEGKDCAR